MKVDIQALTRWTVLTGLCMSLLQLTSAHPCGENPLRRMASLTRILNEVFPDRDMDSIINMLRTSHPEIYRQIQGEWRSYANCVGMVDTGYFKRSNLASKGKRTTSKLTAGLGQDTESSEEYGDEMSFLMDMIQEAVLLNKDSFPAEHGDEGNM
ncbi:hypothetical protein PoB_003516400 [Plakobranchus ocellatus]|uniref:Uncharacterized protein n=1 Tax=Plakobranchus ocellatus TaxID=259542 RepID=A0AAV4ALN5_9GAST|nr:hypothetical protein PoB_003516400 [Plakobranchus ocellatus]